MTSSYTILIEGLLLSIDNDLSGDFSIDFLGELVGDLSFLADFSFINEFYFLIVSTDLLCFKALSFFSFRVTFEKGITFVTSGVQSGSVSIFSTNF